MVNFSSGSTARRALVEFGKADLPGRQKAFLAEASQILSSSLDYEKTLTSITELIVPELADWSVVHILDDAGCARPLAIAHIDPRKVQFGWEVDRLYPVRNDDPEGVAKAVRTREPQLYVHVTEELIQRNSRDAEHQRLARGLGLRSAMVVPLIARDRVLGTLSFATAASGLQYSESDLEFACDLAQRAALAIDNARLYKEAQDAIRRKDEALALLEAVLDQMPAGISIVQVPSGRVLFGNQHAEMMLGQPIRSENLAGLTQLSQLFLSASDIEDGPLIRAAVRHETVRNQEMHIQRADGSNCTVRVSAAPVRNRNGEVIAAVCTAFDTTEQNQAERERLQLLKELERQKTLFEAVVQQLPVGVVVADRQTGDMILRNEAARKFWRTVNIPCNVDRYEQLAAYHPDGRRFERHEWPLMRAVSTGEVITGEELHVVRADGSHAVIRCNAGPIRGNDGDITAAAVAFEDVTERKRAERELAESESKFRTLAEVAPCAIYIYDGERLLYVNRASCDISGYRREQLMLMDPWSLVHPEFAHSVRGAAARIRKGVPVRLEFKILINSGEERWLDCSGSRIDYQGQSAVLAVALDITDRKRVEDALGFSEERLRLAATAAGISTWTWDIRSGVVHWSDESRADAAAASGNDSFETYLNRVHPDDRQPVREALASAIANATDFDAEFRILGRDGQARWVAVRGRVLYDGNGDAEQVVGITMDVTSRKVAEDVVRESEQRFRATFNHTAVGMAHVSPEGRYLLVNQRFAEILRYRPEELVGRGFVEVTHPDDIAANTAALQKMVQGEMDHYSAEKRYLRKDGSEVWVALTSSLLRDAAGAPRYFITAIQDVTERRRAAEALRSSEKLAATGRLAAAIAHEINNPLEAVTNLLYLINQQNTLDAMTRRYTSMAQQELSRVAHIARQALGFYRDSSTPQFVRVSQLMDEVLELFSRKTGVLGVAVTTRYDSEREIEAFPGEIRQVLSNLVANAVDALNDRGGRITIHIRDGRRWSSPRSSGVYVVICDNGGGIEPSQRRRIFEPFYTTKGEKGTGLGLWVTQGILQKHGGTIRVYSSKRPGRSGTCFSVFLPERLRLKNPQ